MTREARIASLAARQEGNVTRRQLARELSPSEISTRVRNGVLIPRHRGVFAYGHVPDAWLSRAFAAWLAYGPDAALSHGACAAVFEVLDEPDGPIHLSRPTGGRSQRGTILHEADLADDLWYRKGLALTSPVRLMLDLAATEPRDVVERAWNAAQVRKLVTPSQLELRIEGWEGRRGVPILRSFIDDRGATRSQMEDAFRALVRRAGLPEPEMNAWVDGVFVDTVWRDQRVIVELDSRGFHEHDSAFESDRSKNNILLPRGWLPLRFTYRRLQREPFAVVAEVVAALTARTAGWLSSA